MTERQFVIYYFYIHGALRDSWLVLETPMLTKGVHGARRVLLCGGTSAWMGKKKKKLAVSTEFC